MKNRLSIAALVASAALAMGVAQPAFSADSANTVEPIVVALAEHDDAVRSNVEAAIAADPRLEGTAIMVSVTEGNVVLSGEVTSEEQKPTAEAAAANVEGVAHVINELTVAH